MKNKKTKLQLKTSSQLASVKPQASRLVNSHFIHLYQGQCQDIFPELAALYPQRRPLIVSDIPYNIGFSRYDIYKDKLPPEEYVSLLSMFRGLPVAIMQYPEHLANCVVSALGPMKRSVMWCYHDVCARSCRQIGFFNVDPDFRQVRRPYRCIEDNRVKSLLAKGKTHSFIYDWWDDIEILKGNSRERRDYNHPCPVPIKLIHRILAICAHEGDLVIDPFSGSQTTAIAAHMLGLDYVGIELSPNYIQQGVERIKREIGVTSVVSIGLPDSLIAA